MADTTEFQAPVAGKKRPRSADEDVEAGDVLHSRRRLEIPHTELESAHTTSISHLVHDCETQLQREPVQTLVSTEIPAQDCKRAMHKLWGGERTEYDSKRWGNFDVHDGYRPGGGLCGTSEEVVWSDERVALIEEEWVRGGQVLDVGCGAGYASIILRERFPSVSCVIGVDIDAQLIKKARFLWQKRSEPVPISHDTFIPQSMRSVQGLVSIPDASRIAHTGVTAPANATSLYFRVGDFVGEDDVAQPGNFYDLVMCLNMTKWVHLNHGDRGLCVLFRKLFHVLKPGGKLMLQMQPWSSYAHSSRLTHEMQKRMKTLEMRPKDVVMYLLKDVGFSKLIAVKTVSKHSSTRKKDVYIFEK